MKPKESYTDAELQAECAQPGFIALVHHMGAPRTHLFLTELEYRYAFPGSPEADNLRVFIATFKDLKWCVSLVPDSFAPLLDALCAKHRLKWEPGVIVAFKVGPLQMIGAIDFTEDIAQRTCSDCAARRFPVNSMNAAYLGPADIIARNDPEEHRIEMMQCKDLIAAITKERAECANAAIDQVSPE